MVGRFGDTNVQTNSQYSIVQNTHSHGANSSRTSKKNEIAAEPKEIIYLVCVCVFICDNRRTHTANTQREKKFQRIHSFRTHTLIKYTSA